MQSLTATMKARAGELLSSGAVSRVLGWTPGELPDAPSPALFNEPSRLETMLYNGFCAANLSKYLVKEAASEGKTLVFLKPCDTYSLNQLLKEHRTEREKIYAVGIGCAGMLDSDKIADHGIRGITGIEENDGEVVFKTRRGDKTAARADILLDKCLACKGKEHMVYDELLDADKFADTPTVDRFVGVEELENMTPDERYAFWRGELSRCIRCNACRNICPACTCVQCVFDNPDSGISSKANSDSFQENMFHIVRAFHVAGRCTDCGECSRVCPMDIPLHLLNRKLIRDMNTLYGEFQAGADTEAASPLEEFTKGDAEPGVVASKGGLSL